MEEIGELFKRRYKDAHLVLSIDPEDRKREGITHPDSGAGRPTRVREHGLEYEVIPGGAHKTGFFCDQRDNRAAVGAAAKGRSVLDLCCNAGGFAMSAARAGARSVVAIDLDEDAVERTRANFKRNGLHADIRQDDAFDALRAARRGDYDLMILDPPKWVRSKDELETGLARYRDLNREALRKCEPGALIWTCSCSGLVDEGLFVRTVREAAAQARRDVQILSLRGAGPDHPIAIEVPESRYLKVLQLRVGDAE
jgi:23S rRNA (cytosine1962-C5)-methyltransferase